MEMSLLIAVGIGLFIFWFLVGAIMPPANEGQVMTSREKAMETTIVCLLGVGFLWFVANMVAPVLQGWLIPPEWVKYSSIFWWISFVGGILGIFVIPKKSKDSKV